MKEQNNGFTSIAVFETPSGRIVSVDCPENYPDCGDNARAVVEILAAEEGECNESELYLMSVI